MIERGIKKHRVFGVDPGLCNIGWGVVEKEGSRFRCLGYGVIRTTSDQPLAARLRAIFEGLQTRILEHQPDSYAIEEVFIGRGAQSSLKAGEGRGVCVLAGAVQDLRVLEYPNNVIKLAVTGNGRAAKIQVQEMVQRLLGLKDRPEPHDAADALAVAITHLQRQRSSAPPIF